MSQRRQHTVNILLQSRHSEVYQSKLDLFGSHVNSNAYISEVLAKKFSSTPEAIDIETRAVLRAGLYVANYFEYLAIGIKRNDLENDLLFDSWGGNLANLERKIFYLIIYSRKKNNKVYENLVWLCHKWLKNDSLLLKYEKNESSVTPEMLGKDPFEKAINKNTSDSKKNKK